MFFGDSEELVLETAIAPDGKAQVRQDWVVEQGFDKGVAGPSQENLHGFEGLVKLSPQLLKGGHPGGSVGILGVDAETGGDEGTDVAQLFADGNTLLVDGLKGGYPMGKFFAGEAFDAIEEGLEDLASSGDVGDRPLQGLDLAGNLRILATSEKLTVIPGLAKRGHRVTDLREEDGLLSWYQVLALSAGIDRMILLV